MRWTPGWGIILSAVLSIATPAAQARDGDPSPASGLSEAQIVAGIQNRNRFQNQSLMRYRALRTYSVVYHGMGTIRAQMQVEVTYDAEQGKSFRIVSQSGALLLRDGVLKRAVESEKEASKQKGSTALTPANYSFRLLGSGVVNGRPVYILDVKPVKPQKFLYRGTIWVDAASFGVMKIEAAPAKNPSIWISHSTISVTDELTDGFWLPKETQSQTAVRLGGRATLTIDYGRYQIEQRASGRAGLLTPADSLAVAKGRR
ncbi:MAG: hypothetical protein ACRD25_09370 [Terracidiphilus sp.]